MEYENQSGAGRLFLFCKNCAGAITRKEEKWKQSFQPAFLVKWGIILIILLRLIKLIIKHGEKERESFKLPYLLATVPLLFLHTS